jgi:hypothetical protein
VNIMPIDTIMKYYCNKNEIFMVIFETFSSCDRLIIE